MGYVDSSIYRWYCAIFEVGLVLLIPLVFTVAKRANVSILKLGLPMVTALSVTHGFLPPHPGPVVIAKELKANIGEVLLYGMIIAIPVTLIAGPIFNRFAQRWFQQRIRERGYFFFRYSKGI